jgi:hypothetical protein
MAGRFVVRKVPEALTREQKRFGGVPCSDLHLMKTLQSWECTDGFVLVLVGWVPPGCWLARLLRRRDREKVARRRSLR